MLSGVAFLCGAANLPERIEVQNGQFAYPFQVNPPRVAALPVQIFEDGTLAGQMQYGRLLEEDSPMFFFPRTDWVTLRGRIAGVEKSDERERERSASRPRSPTFAAFAD